MKTPQRNLHIALIDHIKAFGYAVAGFETFPRVEVINFNTSAATDKDGGAFPISFSLDVITRSGDPTESLDIADDVLDGLEDITVEGWQFCSIFVESIQALHEEDSQGEIYRQIITVTAELLQTTT